MTEPKTDGFRKGDGGIKSNENKGFQKENERFKKKKVKQIERKELLTKEKGERMRSNGAKIEQMDL